MYAMIGNGSMHLFDQMCEMSNTGSYEPLIFFKYNDVILKSNENFFDFYLISLGSGIFKKIDSG